MEALHPIVRSALTGFFSALLLAIPVGPVNLTIINEGARRGFKWALLITLGATTMEVTYCFIAFTGLASFLLTGQYVRAAMEVFSFVFILGLGIKFATAKSVAIQLSAATDRIEARIGEKLHPHSAYMTGFVRVLANPGVMVGWFVLAANFISRNWVTPEFSGRMACVVGVGLGTILWFLVLSYTSSRGKGKFSEQTLLRIERWSGVVLIIFALIDGAWISYEMVQQRHNPIKNVPELHLRKHGR
ncbi:MAG TPA: LysE family transporter [Candidatus Angelobacter sp.]|nr:LysE family transporter [Candidatus Angelobacter sp.]